MEQRVKGEFWAFFQIIAFTTPGYLAISPGHSPAPSLQRIETNAHCGLVTESLHQLPEEFLAHERTSGLNEVFA